MENQRQKDGVATPRGSTSPNETKGLECQTGTTALTEPKGQFGEVANRERGERLLAAMHAVHDAEQALEATLNECWPVGSIITWRRGRGDTIKEGIARYEGSHRSITICNIMTDKQYHISLYDILCTWPDLKERYFER